MSLSLNFPAVRPTLLLDFASQRVLDPRITFVRASPATYYDGETFAKAEENLLLYSQEFDNAGYWTVGNTTVTANATAAPDGTNTADAIFETAVNSLHRIFKVNFDVTSTSLPYTFSIYAKANGRDKFIIRTGAMNSDIDAVRFDLTAITATNIGAGATSSSITAVGNGWYRCVVVFTPTNTGGTFYVGLADPSNNLTYLGNISLGLFIWGAQAEQRTTVTAYAATTTQPITNYIPVLLTAPAGTARFDHNPVTSESLGLLIEETRTNTLTYSSQFNDASWSKLDATITPDTIVAPDGTLSGDKLIATTATGRHVVFKIISSGASNTNTFSCYAKAGEYQFLALSLIQGSNSSGILFIFNLADGTFAQNGAIGGYTNVQAASSAVGNGWYRCSISFTNAAATADYFIMAPSPSATPSTDPFYRTASYTGNGFSGIYIWGAQLEQTNPNCLLPSSYIATVASAVQRNFDNAKLTGTNFSSWWNKQQGSAFIEYVYYGQALNGGALWTQTAANQRLLWQPAAPFIRASTVNTASAGTVAVLAPGRAASAYSAITNETAQSTNGATTVVRTDYNGEISRDYIEISFMHSGGGGNVTLGWCKKVAYYDVRLTNAQLQTLTRN